MKSFKYIVNSLLLALTISLYCGQDIVDKYIHMKFTIENTSNSAGSQNLASSESSFEEDAPIVLSRNSFQIINSGCERISSCTSLFLPELHHSIWQPPKIS